MLIRTVRICVAAAAVAAGGPHGPPAGEPAGDARLAVWTGRGWDTFWTARQGRSVWRGAHPVVTDAVAWEQVAPGVELGEIRVAGAQRAWRVRVVLARLDPRALAFALNGATRDGGLLGAWTVDSLPSSAGIAFNAGMFDGGQPWGWHVEGGRELQPPGTGPLSMAVTVDTAGVVQLLHGEEIEAARSDGRVALAFQSYPAVLVGDGAVPSALLGPGRGVDLVHRDARLALGILRDGRVLLALTRFDALGEAAAQLPIGPTTPEMAALLGALGSRRAVLLDGGLSAQLAVRVSEDSLRIWRGLRRVPLGVVAVPPALNRRAELPVDRGAPPAAPAQRRQ